MAIPRAARFVHIDALRGIAALLVVWHHTSESFALVTQSALWVHDFAAMINAGRIGVVVFFLVSGFVIPSSLDKQGPRLALAGDFAIKRFFRLYPAYWLSIPLGILTFYLIWDRPVTLPMVLANFTMIQEFLGFQSAQGLYWTLQTELVFYALCIVVFLTVGLKSTAVVTGIASLLLVMFVVRIGPLADGTIHNLVGHLSIMFTGTLLRRWHDGRLAGMWPKLMPALLVLFWLVLPLSEAVGRVNGLPHVAPSYAIAMAIFLLGAFVIRIRARWLVTLGIVSYSLYLFHPVVFWAMVRVIQTSSSPVFTGYPLYVYVLTATALSIAVAFVIYRWIETPANALGAKLTRLGPNADMVEAI